MFTGILVKPENLSRDNVSFDAILFDSPRFSQVQWSFPFHPDFQTFGHLTTFLLIQAGPDPLKMLIGLAEIFRVFWWALYFSKKISYLDALFIELEWESRVETH